MSEAKHTPGPWHVLNHGPHYNNPRIDHLEIAWTEHGELVTELVYGKENADLISASPDLLAALERMEHAFHLLLQSKPVRDADEVLAEARAAKAKAKGHSL